MPNYVLSGRSWPVQPISWDFAAATLPQDSADTPFSNAITQQDAQAVISTAFEAWSRAAGLRFVYAPQDNAAVDIRIGWGTLTPPTATGREIGETSYYYNSVTNDILPDVLVRLLDPDQLALTGTSGTLAYGDGSSTLYQVALHELGHAIGLEHDTANPDAVMYPYLGPGNRLLSADDIAGAQAIYGPPPAAVINIGANQETVAGSLSGAPATIFGGSGALDYAGNTGLIIMEGGSARIHDGTVTVFAASGPMAASNNQHGEFILGSGYSSIAGGLAGSTDIVFGGSGIFTYAGGQEAASVIGGSGSATVTGGTGGGYYSGGGDGNNSLTATGIGSVLIGGGNNDRLQAAATGYNYLVAGAGNETLLGAGGGTDRFYLGSGQDQVALAGGSSLLVTGSGSATITGAGGSSSLSAGTGSADLFEAQAGASMAITGFREGVDRIGAAPASLSVTGGSTLLHFADGSSITLNGLSDPTGAGLLG